MSIFLRSMLSDGAGAFLLEDRQPESGLSFQVNWTYSRSFAHIAPLCMKLENRTLLLSQDVEILSEHLKPCTRKVVEEAFRTHDDDLSSYRCVLPHLSSFFFKRYLLSVLKEFCHGNSVPYWTNLETAGNTGAASIYLMLDEYARSHPPADGDKLILFIPESGQFNFALVSLTARHS
jgi:3-oxoacyl-[acyl-carrier-protein] synthase-3